MAIKLDPETGQYWQEMPGGYYEPVAPEQLGNAQAGPMEAFGRAALAGAGQLSVGIPAAFGNTQANTMFENMQGSVDALSRENPLAAILGQSAPAVGIGAALAPLGMGAMAGGEVAMGAAMAPANPVLGAVLGAGGVAAGPAARAAGRFAGIVDDVKNATMPERVAAKIGGYMGDAGQADNRVRVGDLPANWFDEKGVPLIPYQRASLMAETPDDMLTARKLAWVDEMQGGSEPILSAQRQAMTQEIQGIAGVPQHQALTATAMGNLFTATGDAINHFTSVSGPIKLADGALDAMKAIVKDADSNFKGAMSSVVADIEKGIKKGNGAIDPVSFQTQLTRLGDMSKPGTAFEKAEMAGQIAEHLHDALYATLNAADKKALQEARYQYRIAKTLNTGAVVGKDGYINPRSFEAAWRRRTPLRGLGKDYIGQLAQTFSGLENKLVHPGSTMARRIIQAPAVIKKGIPAAVGAATGIPILGSLL